MLALQSQARRMAIMSFRDRQSQNFVGKLEMKGTPLFSLPCVTDRTMKPDLMHVLDERCAASAAGQVLAELQRKCTGSNKKERAQALWKEIQTLYETDGIPACRRLKKLTVKDVQKPGKAAVLGAKAAEVRHFCTDILEPLAKSKKLQEGSMHDKAVYNVAKHCTDMFRHLEIFNSRQLVKSGQKFISQYVALEQEALHVDPEETLTWRAKPEPHYLGHILDEARKGHQPKDSWAYRDETEGFQFQSFLQKRRAARAWLPGREGAPEVGS